MPKKLNAPVSSFPPEETVDHGCLAERVDQRAVEGRERQPRVREVGGDCKWVSWFST